MFNKDFYPTPKEVIEQMMFGIDIANNVFLEPSAGKGNIVDYLNEHSAKEVLTCEINPDLAKIAGSKGRLIANDFLTVQKENISHINTIVMNPPFSADEDHILHAWSVAPDGCIIVSLCNENTVGGRGYYGRTEKQKKIMELIELYGRTEELGDCFSTAERKTDVRVACVWLYKPKQGEEEWDDYFSMEESDFASLESGVVQYNYIRDIVNRYVAAIKLFDKIEPLATEINELTKSITEYGVKFGAFGHGDSANTHNLVSRETYKKELQKQAWHKIFSEMKMNKYLTNGVIAKINKFVETQIHVPFTMKNVYKMLEIIVGTHDSRMEQVLVEAFETICSFAWKENCTGGEHWKTNSDYVINKRFIVPYVCEQRVWARTEYVGVCNDRGVDDVIKALCHLTGKNYDELSKGEVDDENKKKSWGKNLREINQECFLWGKWYEWGEFFRVRGYKKGTMHFEFIDDNVLEMFNRRVAEIKGWRLPQHSNMNKKKKKEEADVNLFGS